MNVQIPVAGDTDGESSPVAAPTRLDSPTQFERLLGVASAGVFVTFMSTVFIANRPLRDPDVWWHIIMGHAYLDGTSVQNPGPMSPFGTEDWQSRDWLPQVLMALFDGAFGLSGVAWLHGLALVTLFVVCFRLCRRLVPFGPAVIATGIAFYSMMGSLSPRPQVVSFILLVVTVSALLRTVEDLRPRWWLAAVTAVWACSHGMWFLSPGLQVVVLFGLLLERRLDTRALRPHALLLCVCVAAVAVTPNGVHQLANPLGASMETFRYIEEYQPPSMSFPHYVAALIMLFGVCVAWARQKGESWVAVLLVGSGAFLTLYMGRTIPLGGILLMPFFARAVASWWPQSRAYLPRVAERAVLYGGAIGSLLAMAIMMPASAAAPDNLFPTTYDARLSALPADAVLINELGDGGYLAWKHPNLRIVGDGLSDQYTVQWLEDWYQALRGEPGWNEFVEQSGADYALLRDTTALRLGLASRGWTTVEEGENRVLLKAPEG